MKLNIMALSARLSINGCTVCCQAGLPGGAAGQSAVFMEAAGCYYHLHILAPNLIVNYYV